MNTKNCIAIFLLLLSMLPMNALACCNCCACGPCVMAVLQAVRASSQAAFQALETSISSLDQVIEAGIRAEDTAYNYQKDQIIAAIQASSSSMQTELIRNGTLATKGLDSTLKSLEQMERTKLTAEANFNAATEHGYDSIPYLAKILTSVQKSTVIIDGTETEQLASVNYLMRHASQKASSFLDEIFPDKFDDPGLNGADLSALMHVNIGPGNNLLTIPAEELRERILARRFIAVPLSVQMDARAYDISESDMTGYWSIVKRSKSAAEFLAWDLAIRAEVETDSGYTSALNFFESITKDHYESLIGLHEDTSAGERELLQGISHGIAIGNLLDTLANEAERHQLNMQASITGFYNDYANHAVYGRNTQDIKSLQRITK